MWEGCGQYACLGAKRGKRWLRVKRDKCWLRAKNPPSRNGFFVFAKAKVSALSIVPASLRG